MNFWQKSSKKEKRTGRIFSSAFAFDFFALEFEKEMNMSQQENKTSKTTDCTRVCSSGERRL
jgi:hypothetical protein